MEQNLRQALPLKVATATFEDPYKDVELTDDEVAEALRAAKHKKATQIFEKQYWENINKPIVYPVWTTNDLYREVVKKIQMTVPNFILDENNQTIFKKLCLYFTKDPEFLKFEDEKGNRRYSFEKGIALIGPVGCGKTTLLRGFNINPTNSYHCISCRAVAGEYTHKEGGGKLVIDRYSSIKEVAPREHFGQIKVGQMFDDLGTEVISRHFGNERNVMEEILLNRYDNYELKGKTHITSNLSADEIEEVYGTRLRSRFREMFNWLKFDPETPDRRN